MSNVQLAFWDRSSIDYSSVNIHLTITHCSSYYICVRDNSDYYSTITLLPYPELLSAEQHFLPHLQFENAREISINETSIIKRYQHEQPIFYVIYILYILYYISLLYVILYYIILK